MPGWWQKTSPCRTNTGFLLFPDKKQVELIWNDKIFEIMNLALPFQMIEAVDEPREEEPERGDQQQFF